MINPIKQGFVASSNLNATKTDKLKETKTEQAQKADNDRVSKIAEQIKNGSYKLDMKATANAIADSLI